MRPAAARRSMESMAPSFAWQHARTHARTHTPGRPSSTRIRYGLCQVLMIGGLVRADGGRRPCAERGGRGARESRENTQGPYSHDLCDRAVIDSMLSNHTHSVASHAFDLQGSRAPLTAPLSPNTCRAGCPCSSCANREPSTRGAACYNTHRRICSSFAAHAPI